jgi:N-acyl-D-amino-acid deacylase
MDLMLTGGLLVDGTGTMPQHADVLVRDGHIARILDRRAPMADSGPADPPGTVIRDVSGLVVAPGFVDIHTHSDLTLLSSPLARSKVAQGVTTEVVGNCGLGVAPLTSRADIAAIRQAVSYLDLDPAVRWDWIGTADYLRAIELARPSLGVATLTGHLPLRAGTTGFTDRPATGGELAEMQALLADAFAEGSLGLSTGLVYAPLCYATEDELIALGQTVADHDRVFTWHVRNYDDDLLPSIEQALRVARHTGCRTQISHLAAVGKRNWGGVARALDLVDDALAEGLRVGVDAYPYLHGNAPLAQLLPAWVQDGGPDGLAARLRAPGAAEKIGAFWADRPLSWDEITISRVPPGHLAEEWQGRTITEIARNESRDPDAVALGLLVDLGTAVLMVAGGRSEDDLRTVLAHPAAVVASDGLSLDPDGVTGAGSPHPRSYGCFPRFLSRYAGHDGAAIGRAVRQCTAAPAALIGLDGRGLLREGAPADVVAFSLPRLADRATFDAPQQYPDGIELVLVGGEPVVDAGVHTGSRPGTVLRRH